MTHLSDDERLAAIEGVGPNRHPHLAECERCRRAVAEGRALLEVVRAADVPEPSPLFWDHLSSRVSACVQAEPDPGREPRRAPLRFLVPLTAVVALLVMLVAIGTRRAAPPRTLVALGGPDAIEHSASDQSVGGADGWSLLGEVASDFDVETLGDSLGHSLRGGVDAELWQLNDGERAELARLLETEMTPARSGS